VIGYRVVALAGTGAPSLNCNTGTPLYAGAATAFTQGGLAAGAKVTYRVCAVDLAGNVSAGAIATGAAK
jgi:hypothetical protein